MSNRGTGPEAPTPDRSALQMLEVIDFWADDHIGEAEAESLKEMTGRARAALAQPQAAAPAQGLVQVRKP